MNTRMTPQPHHNVPAMVPPPNCFSVLVVDDMVPNRLLLRKMLTAAGYSVAEASDGSEALEMLEQGVVAPDIIITDIEMPRMNGVTLIDGIRNLGGDLAGIPVIAASGNADDSMRDNALGAGSDVFLTKPFDFPRLRKEMAKLLKARRGRTTPRIVVPSQLHERERTGWTAA